jgi:HD-like signal output (HDOD) protein
VADAARLVEQDPAVTAKVLQLANSAFFGRPRPVNDVDDAIGYLGMNTLKALALSADCIEAFKPAKTIEGFSIESLQDHSALTARITRRIASGGDAGGAVAAALVHEVGNLILAARAPDYLASVLARAGEENRPPFEVEQETRGFTHADVGAHLLSLWGLPETIVDAVAQHHRPASRNEPGMSAVTAVHVACALADGGEHLDLEHLERTGLSDRIPAWRAIAAQEIQR